MTDILSKLQVLLLLNCKMTPNTKTIQQIMKFRNVIHLLFLHLLVFSRLRHNTNIPVLCHLLKPSVC